jgi:hypothetical protein
MGTPDTLIADLAAADARIEQAARPLDAARLGWHPPEGGWSIADVLEHLCISNDDYLAKLRPLVNGGGARRAARAGAGAEEWRPSFFGGFLARSLGAPRKLPAPKMWRIERAPRANVLDEFLAREREIAQLLRASTAFDWRRTRLASPVSRLIRLNLGDAFAVLAVHSARHAGQIERVRAHPAFPAA